MTAHAGLKKCRRHSPPLGHQGRRRRHRSVAIVDRRRRELRTRRVEHLEPQRIQTLVRNVGIEVSRERCVPRPDPILVVPEVIGRIANLVQVRRRTDRERAERVVFAEQRGLVDACIAEARFDLLERASGRGRALAMSGRPTETTRRTS